VKTSFCQNSKAIYESGVKSYLVDEDLVDAAALDVESLKKLLLPVVPHLM
jgi:hypothetical protein